LRFELWLDVFSTKSTLYVMAAPKVKTNKLAIYMIKSDFQRLEDIASSKEEPLTIDGIGHFIFDESHPRSPDWVEDFFGSVLNGDNRLLTASAKGILIVPVKKGAQTTNFAVSFGFGRHLLKEGVIEERFGLKVVLNSLDPSSFRSINKTALGSVPKHSQEQMSRDVPASDFGIDIEQDLISSVSGKSRDEKLGKLITGKDALSVSVKTDITNIRDFLLHCLDRYHSEDYKKDFEWIDQIADVRDGRLEDELNVNLVDKLNRADLGRVWMAVPEVVNLSDIKGFRYLRGKRADLHDDLDVSDFLKEFNNPVTTELLKLSQVFMISAATDDGAEQWSAFRCIYSEITLHGEVYILNNGKWYKIAKGFTDQVQEDFNTIARATIALPE